MNSSTIHHPVRSLGHMLGRAWVLSLCLMAGLGMAHAQDAWPTRPIKLLVGFAPGGSSDMVARLIATPLGERLGQPIVVENRAGAAGNLGTEIVGRAAPDGYTLLANSFGPIAINPTLFSHLPYNAQRDLQPVALIAEVPTVLVVPSVSGIQSLPELLKFAKGRPNDINYASTGIGTSAHMTGFLFSQRSQLNAIHVPYKGAEATRDLVAGRIHYMFATVPSVIPLIKAGQLKALAVSTKMRSRSLPDVPTLSEAGVAGYEATIWLGIMAPKGTPKAIVDKLNETVSKIASQQDVKQQWAKQGAAPLVMNPVAFDKYLQDDIAKWSGVIKSANIKLD